MLISLTVGKVDAGVAVLLTEDKRLIEFPSILLPPSISSGSIVDITVSRNHASENAAKTAFDTLQTSIFSKYGRTSPSTPILRCRNATQTSVVLEWDPIALATADLRSLSLYRNGSKAGSIPRPLEITSTKISGLAIDTEYVFHLILRTSAGIYSSEKFAVRTHKMTDLSGITVTPGVLPTPLRYSLAGAVERIGAKLVETVRIDTTHFVCTEGRGREWERAVEMNIPVVRPEWVEGCEHEGRIVGVRGYYLNADPRLRQVGQGVATQNPRRTESQTGIKKVAPASLGTQEALGPASAGSQWPLTEESETSGVSPMSSTNSNNNVRLGATVPPTPPEKDFDPRHEAARGAARGAPPGSANVSPVQGEDFSEEEESAEEKVSRPQARELVQSPFEKVGKSSELPVRTGNGSGEVGGRVMGRETSDGGSFSEVAL